MFWNIADWTTYFTRLNIDCSLACDEFDGILFRNPRTNNFPTPELQNMAATAWAQFNPNSNFFFQVLDEVRKTLVCIEEGILDVIEILDDHESQRLLEEHSFHQRRLLEILQVLIITSSLPNPARSVEHYGLYVDVIYLLRKHCEIAQSFGGSGVGNNRVLPLAERRRARIEEIELSGDVDPSRCLYLEANLRSSIPGSVTGWMTNCRRIPRVLASTASMLGEIFSRTDTNPQERLERAVLGFTYNGLFGRSSSEVHFTPTSFLPVIPDISILCSAVTVSSLLCVTILLRCFAFTNRNPLLTANTKLVSEFLSADIPFYASVVDASGVQAGDLIFSQGIDSLGFWEEVQNILRSSRSTSLNYVSYEVRDASGNNIIVPSTDVLLIVQQRSFRFIVSDLYPGGLAVAPASAAGVLPLLSNSTTDRVLKIAFETNGLLLGAKLLQVG